MKKLKKLKKAVKRRKRRRRREREREELYHEVDEALPPQSQEEEEEDEEEGRNQEHLTAPVEEILDPDWGDKPVRLCRFRVEEYCLGTITSPKVPPKGQI